MKRKINTKTNIAVAFVSVILLFILYGIGSVYIWGVQLAERELTKYSAEILGLQEEIHCRYDWHNNRYSAINALDFTLDYRRDHDAIHDESFAQQENERLQGDYSKFVGTMNEKITLPRHVAVWTEISSKNYELKAQRLYLLGIYNTENLSREDSLKMPASIAMNIIEQLGGDYNFTGIQATYCDKNGMFEIAFPADSFVPITQDKLCGHTHQIPEDDYPESYKNWLAENRALWSE